MVIKTQIIQKARPNSGYRREAYVARSAATKSDALRVIYMPAGLSGSNGAYHIHDELRSKWHLKNLVRLARQ